MLFKYMQVCVFNLRTLDYLDNLYNETLGLTDSFDVEFQI